MKREKYEKGMAVRREVLGDEYVDKALAGATDFTQPLQDLVTENCWGEVWTRDAISKKTRSLVTIAILAALKAPAEIKLHVRGALRNGCTAEEIQDVLLQATVYCGVPAGVDAFRAAKDVIDTDLLRARYDDDKRKHLAAQVPVGRLGQPADVAALVAYSRIYVGLHFPLDAIGGALLGILLGLFLVFTAPQLQV